MTPSPSRSGERRPVTVLGAGMMGSAVVRALLTAGHPVHVWNRTRSRADALADIGAVVVDDVTAAIRSGDVVISMLLTNDVVLSTLAAPAAAGALRDRVVVNLTTVMPQDVPELAAFVEANGGRFLDGIIAGYPDAIGRRGAALLCAGRTEVWEEVADIVRTLGGRSHLVGEDVRVAAVVDSAMIGYLALTTQVAVVEALAYASSLGVAPRQVLPYLNDVAAAMPHLVGDLVDRVEREAWTTERVTLDTLRFSMDLFRDSGTRAGMPAGTVAAAADLLARACAAGRHDDDLVALYQVLREHAAPPER